MKAIDFLEDEMSEVTLRHIREIDYLEDWIVSAMKAYAKAKLEEAAEEAEVWVDWDDGIPYAVLDKQSITNKTLN